MFIDVLGGRSCLGSYCCVRIAAHVWTDPARPIQSHVGGVIVEVEGKGGDEDKGERERVEVRRVVM